MDAARELYLSRAQNSSAKRKGHPATWVTFSSRENSSNGGEAVKTFWRNLMSQKSRGQVIFGK
jgi:hypothetical protein